VSGWSAVHAWAPLPALYVLLLALAGAAALRRWFDPLPARVLLLFLLYVALLLAPVLAGDAVLLPVDILRIHAPYLQLAPSEPRAVFLQRDLVHQIAPWELLVKRALAEGRWPLWNAWEGAGMPLMADPQAQAFQPLVALAYPFSIWTAAGVTAAAKLLSALVFSFLLFRRQGLGEPAAAAGATAFGLSGFMLLWLGWPLATCAALLPAVLYAIARCDEVGERRDFLLLALATAALLLAGHPETLVYAAAFAALFLLDRCHRRWRERRHPPRPQSQPQPDPQVPAELQAQQPLSQNQAEPRSEPRPQPSPRATPFRSSRSGGALLARTGLAAALGAALAAPVLLPAVAFLPTTQRSAIVRAVLAPLPLARLWHDLQRPEALALWRSQTIHRLVPAVAPNAFGDLRTVYWGESNYIQDTGEFAGTATLLLTLLALAALVPLRTPGRLRPGGRTGPPGGSGLTAAAGPSPPPGPSGPSGPLPAEWPRRRRFPQERLAGLCLLGSLALLAQPPGFDRLAARLPLVGLTAAHRHQRIQVVVTFCVAYLAACGLERWQRGLVRRRALALSGTAVLALIAAGYLANARPGQPEGPWDFRIGWLAWQAAAAGAALLCLWLGQRRRIAGARPQPPPSRLPVPQPLVSQPVPQPPVPQPPVTQPPLPRPPAAWAPWAVTAIVAAELLGFYLGVNPPNERRLAFPRLPAVRFLATHLGGDRLVGALGALPANFAAVYGLADARIDNPSIPALYALATSGLDVGLLEPRFRRFGHPLYDFLGVRFVIAPPGRPLRFRLAFADATAWIWERQGPLPRLFLPERAHVDRDPGAVGGASSAAGDNWWEWLESNPDFGFRVLVEPSPFVHRRWRAARPDASSLRLELRAPTRLRAEADMAEPRLLAASIYQDGGWRVLAGGSPVPAVRVNRAFTGAWLPPGRARIDLLYRPAPLLWGCLLAALAAAAAVAWWVPPPQEQMRYPLARSDVSSPVPGLRDRRRQNAPSR
jgi:hypothetical protein